MHHHPLSPPSLFCLPLQVESIAPVSCHMVPGNRIPAYYYLSPSLWCQCSCGCRSWLEVRGTFNGGCCGRTDGRCWPPVCASTVSARVHFTWEPFNHAMDSWRVASAFLLTGLVSCAALSAFDTGKSETFLPSRFGDVLRLWIRREASPKFCARESVWRAAK